MNIIKVKILYYHRTKDILSWNNISYNFYSVSTMNSDDVNNDENLWVFRITEDLVKI